MQDTKNIIERFKKEFVSDSELAGTNGYCNPVMAERIAEWWADKVLTELQALKEEVDQLTVYMRIAGGDLDEPKESVLKDDVKQAFERFGIK
jgi:hypothetical protein